MVTDVVAYVAMVTDRAAAAGDQLPGNAGDRPEEHGPQVQGAYRVHREDLPQPLPGQAGSVPHEKGAYYRANKSG